MVGEATSAVLVRLGLTTYEAKAYVALIRRDSATASEVARLALVPRQRIYDVLATLAGKGLVSARPGRVAKYRAVSPEVAVERLLDQRRDALVELEHEAVSTLAELGPAYLAGRDQSDPLEYIEVLRDREAINTRFEQLQAETKRELLIFTRPPYASMPQENVRGLDVARTHRARSVYELSVLEDRDFLEGLITFIEAGEQARFVEELPLKLVIIDETIVMFGMQDPVAGSAELTLMVVEHPSLARVLKIAFEAVWATGVTFEQAQSET